MLVAMLSSLATRAAALDERVRGSVLGAGRIVLGLLWLANLHWKVPPAFGDDTGGGLFKYSAAVVRHSPFAPFGWVTEEIVLPNFRLFGWVTLVTELLLAMLLLIGYRTKIVALVGAVWSVPIMLSVLYYDRADEWSWSYLLMIAAHLMAYASDAGTHLGLDGVLRRDAAVARRAVRAIGIIAIGVGAAGLFVARSVSFAGDRVALFGSDAGFTTDDGSIVRRWELKFLWFNPMWALCTVVLGAVLVAGVRQQWVRRAGGVGFAVLAVVILVVQRFDYLRDDGSIQVVSTASNAAVWGAAALVVLLVDRVLGSTRVPADPA